MIFLYIAEGKKVENKLKNKKVNKRTPFNKLVYGFHSEKNGKNSIYFMSNPGLELEH